MSFHSFLFLFLFLFSSVFLLTSTDEIVFLSFGTLKNELWDSGFFLAQSFLLPTNATGLPVLTLCLLCVFPHAQKHAISSDHFSFTQWCVVWLVSGVVTALHPHPLCLHHCVPHVPTLHVQTLSITFHFCFVIHTGMMWSCPS